MVKMPVIETIVNATGHVVGKIVALAGIATITAVVPYLTSLLNQPTPEGIWVVTIVAAIVIWQKAIIPIVNEALEAAQAVLPKNTAIKNANAQVKDYLSISAW
jgi:hypothetical protein